MSFDKEDFLKNTFLLGDQGLPMFLGGVMERGDQYATTGGFVGGGDQYVSVHDVGAELPLESFGEGKEGAFGGDGSVIKVVVGPVDAGGDIKHAAVGRDGRIEPCFFFESFAKDQAVVFGGSTEPMVKDPPIVVFVTSGDGAKGRVGDVEKAESVAIPDHRGPAGLVDAVGEMGFCGDIEDADLGPIAAFGGEGVGKEASAGRGRGLLEGDGAVFAEGVGIEEDAGRCVIASFGGIEDGLVFESFAAEEKVAVSVALGACAGLVVVEFFEFVEDGLASGDLLK